MGVHKISISSFAIVHPLHIQCKNYYRQKKNKKKQKTMGHHVRKVVTHTLYHIKIVLHLYFAHVMVAFKIAAINLIYSVYNCKRCMCLKTRQCITYNNETATTIIGPYPYLIYPKHLNLGGYCSVPLKVYQRLPENLTELTSYFCEDFNREGPLCSQCKPGYI